MAFRVQGPDGHRTNPLYSLNGTIPTERIAPDLAGPGGEQPVRFGNAAWEQLQLDSEPSILLGLWTHVLSTGDWDYLRERWPRVLAAAEAVVRLWREPENGIWEIRERRDHWLYGKSLCAAGLLAAAELAEGVGEVAWAGRWRAEANQIRAEVVERGWNEERRAYLQTYAPESPLDISALALSLWGLLPPHDPRLTATAQAMELPLQPPAGPPITGTDTPYWGRRPDNNRGLNMNGGIARYDYAAVPFYLPTLWLGRHYLLAGQRDRALGLARVCLNAATSLGLMAEHFDPATGEQWGNFPQAFNHAELVFMVLEMGRRSRLRMPPVAPASWAGREVVAG